MQKCPKCNKTYDDSWKICLRCDVQLTSVVNNISTQQPLSKDGGDKPSEKKISRATNMVFIGIGLCAFSLLYAIASEGFSYDILTQKHAANFRFYGLASVYGIVLAYLAPYGGIGLILLYRGKKKLSKNRLYDRLFLLFLFPIFIGYIVLFLFVLQRYKV